MPNFRALRQLFMDILHLKKLGDAVSVVTNAVVFVCHIIGLNVLHIDLIYQSFHLKSMFLCIYLTRARSFTKLAGYKLIELAI